MRVRYMYIHIYKIVEAFVHLYDVSCTRICLTISTVYCIKDELYGQVEIAETAEIEKSWLRPNNFLQFPRFRSCNMARSKTQKLRKIIIGQLSCILICAISAFPRFRPGPSYTYRKSFISLLLFLVFHFHSSHIVMDHTTTITNAQEIMLVHSWWTESHKNSWMGLLGFSGVQMEVSSQYLGKLMLF